MRSNYLHLDEKFRIKSSPRTVFFLFTHSCIERSPEASNPRIPSLYIPKEQKKRGLKDRQSCSSIYFDHGGRYSILSLHADPSPSTSSKGLCRDRLQFY